MISSFPFDPSAVRTVSINWARWPFPPGTRIASATWTIPPAFEVLAQSITGMKTNVKVRFKLGFGSPTNYQFACHMVTNQFVVPPDRPAQDTRRIGIEVRWR